MLLFASLAYALPIATQSLPNGSGPSAARSELSVTFDAAAEEFGVPKALLMALAWEASHFDPDVVSAWGGYGMFDLREGDLDPSLEHASALLEVDPDAMIADWRLQVRGAA